MNIELVPNIDEMISFYEKFMSIDRNEIEMEKYFTKYTGHFIDETSDEGKCISSTNKRTDYNR